MRRRVRQVAVTAGLPPPAGSSGFAVLWAHELDVLDSLDGWMTRLFLRLVRISDFTSGAGTTTFAELVAYMTPIQPRRGPRLFAPDVQAVKRAIAALEKRRILTRDKGASQRARLLFFVVASRRAAVRPMAKLDPLTRPPVDNENRALKAH